MEDSPLQIQQTDLSLIGTPGNGEKLIDLKSLVEAPAPNWVRNGLGTSLEHLLAIHKVNGLYQSIPSRLPAVDFCRKSLEVLNINYAVIEQELVQIPKSGPLVMVANHPFGGVEGIILAEILLNTRPDVRILGNFLLEQIPELKDKIIAVDPFDPKRATARNARSIRAALKWLKQGGALLTFPSGEVAHWSVRAGRIVDPPWHPHVARLITMAKAKTLPVYIHGRNSVLFNMAGMVHPRLRTLLLPREMIKKHAETIELSFLLRQADPLAAVDGIEFGRSGDLFSPFQHLSAQAPQDRKNATSTDSASAPKAPSQATPHRRPCPQSVFGQGDRSAARNSHFDCARHADIEDISLLVSEIESDRKGVPTLIKHYLKLNGRFLAFNIDRDFANVIDGLVWVDLLKTDPKILRRFMGEAGANAFLDHYKADLYSIDTRIDAIRRWP